MTIVTIILLVAFISLLYYTIKGIYTASQKPVGSRFKIGDRTFEVMKYDPTCRRSKCACCDMKYFPVMARKENNVCTRVPFCNSNERRDKQDVYFLLVSRFDFDDDNE